jgi:hypothetical protein
MGNLKKILVGGSVMLRGTRFVFSNSKYPLFRDFTLVFDFKAKADKDWVDEELFAKVEPMCLEFNYYGSKLFVFVFKISSFNMNYCITYEFYESAYGSSSSIADIFISEDFVVRVGKYGRYVRFGGGWFKVFSTIDEMERYYDRYVDEENLELDDEEEENNYRYCDYEEELELEED